MKSIHDEHEDISAVLLVCVFNKLGKILTHDYFHQIFSPFGKIVRILIFDKAKVWKTFIQFQELEEAKEAKYQLNNLVVFEDGSKLNIFYAKLKSIALQNSNIGGVDYRKFHSPYHETSLLHEFHQIRNRSSTAISPYLQNSKYEAFTRTEHFQHSRNSSESSYCSNIHSFSESNAMNVSKRSETEKSSEKVFKSQTEQNEYNSFFCDVDQQFKELALQSQQYREWSQSCLLQKDNTTDKLTGERQKNEQKSLRDLNQFNLLEDNKYDWLEEENIQIRKKSKTYLPPSLTNQFIQENIPSQVLFVRSIPTFFTAKAIENIFANFGKMNRLIYLKSKMSALIQYQILKEAMQAKDELNYTKCQMKVFYSHYETLESRNDTFSNEDSQEIDLRSQSRKEDSYQKNTILNPPLQTLYLSYLNPQNESQLVQKCLKMGCKIQKIQWKQTKNKDYHKGNKFNSKWTCLIQLTNINQSLIVMGFLQGYRFFQYPNKGLKISFTRSKITKGKQIKNNQSQYSNIEQKTIKKQTQNTTRIRYNTVSFKSIPQNQE